MGKWKYLPLLLVPFVVYGAYVEIAGYYRGYPRPSASGDGRLGPWRAEWVAEDPLRSGGTVTFAVRLHCDGCRPNYRAVRIGVGTASGAAAPVEMAGEEHRLVAEVPIPPAGPSALVVSLAADGWDGERYVARWPLVRRGSR